MEQFDARYLPPVNELEELRAILEDAMRYLEHDYRYQLEQALLPETAELEMRGYWRLHNAMRKLLRITTQPHPLYAAIELKKEPTPRTTPEPEYGAGNELQFRMDVDWLLRRLELVGRFTMPHWKHGNTIAMKLDARRAVTEMASELVRRLDGFIDGTEENDDATTD